MNIRKDSGPLKWILIGISVLFLFVMLILPLSYVMYTAFSKGIKVFLAAVTDKYALHSIKLTIEVSLIAVVCNTFFGIFASWLITKFQFKGKKIISTLIDLPLTVSPIIAGLIYVLTFGRQSFIYPYLKAMGVRIIFAVPGIVLATIFVTFPFISRELIPVLTSQGTDEEEAAALMGANGWTIFWKVTFPHIKWPLLYGIVLCTARAMGEFGAVSVLSGHLRGRTNTMPLYIELLYQGYDFTGAFAVSAILVLMAVIILVLRSVLEYKGQQAAKSEKETAGRIETHYNRKAEQIMAELQQDTEKYVELRNINKTYGTFKASNNINLGIEKGKLIALLGPSGSGKTTILRMIAGLETADSGDIIIDGKVVNDVPASKRGIGFVFQNYALFRYMTVYDNIAFGLKVNKWKKSDIKKRVDELIELVGLSGMAKRYPSQLSGGQRQRVAFARALAPNPELLLLDEPFAAIDAKVRQELRSWLRDMITKVGITSIFVTHDQDEAIEVADEIIVTNKGHIEQIGTPRQIYREPETAFMAEFMGHPVHVDRINKIKGFNQLDDSVKAVLRPENVNITRLDEKVDSAASVEKGVVVGKLFMGKEVEITVNVNGIEVVGTRNVEEAPIKKGEEVNVFIHRAFTYGADGIVNIVENANKFEDWMVI